MRNSDPWEKESKRGEPDEFLNLLLDQSFQAMAEGGKSVGWTWRFLWVDENKKEVLESPGRLSSQYHGVSAMRGKLHRVNSETYRWSLSVFRWVLISSNHLKGLKKVVLRPDRARVNMCSLQNLKNLEFIDI